MEKLRVNTIKDLDLMKVTPKDLVLLRPREAMDSSQMMKLNLSIQEYCRAQDIQVKFMLLDHKTDISVLRGEKC